MLLVEKFGVVWALIIISSCVKKFLILTYKKKNFMFQYKKSLFLKLFSEKK